MRAPLLVVAALLSAAALFAIVDTASSQSEQINSYSLVGQVGGETRAVSVLLPRAYIGVGPRIVVINVRDPRNPFRESMSDVLPDLVDDIVVTHEHEFVPNGKHAFVANRSAGLQVFDVADPEVAPRLIATIDTAGEAVGVELSSHYLYVADGPGGMLIFDVAEPTEPRLLGRLEAESGDGNEMRKVIVAADRAFIIDRGRLLEADVSDHTDPRVVSEIPFVSEPLDLHVEAGLAAVVLRTGLRLVDLTVPGEPEPASSIQVPDARVAYLSADVLHLVRDSKFELYDVRDTSAPQQLGRSVATARAPTAIDLQAGWAFVSDGAWGLHIVDVSYPPDPLVLADQYVGSGIYDAAVDGASVLGAGLEAGLHVVAVADSSRPDLVGWTDTLGPARSVAASSQLAYVGTQDMGLQIFDTTDPSSPTAVGSVADPQVISEVVISGTVAYLAAAASGLQLVDVEVPSSPFALGSSGVGTRTVGVAVARDTAAVARLNDIAIVDVSDSASPVLLASLDTPGTAEGVELVGDFLYVADALHGLTVVDISARAAPKVVANTVTPGMAWRVRVVDDLAHVADGWDGGVRVFDVSDPTDPHEVDSVFVPGLVHDVELVDDIMYVSSLNGGMYVYRRSAGEQLTPSPTPTQSVAPTSPTVAVPSTTPSATPTAIGATTIYLPDLRVEYVPVDAPAYAVAASNDYAFFGSGPRTFNAWAGREYGFKALGVSERIAIDAATPPFECNPRDMETGVQAHAGPGIGPGYVYALCNNNRADRWQPGIGSALVTVDVSRLMNPEIVHVLPLEEITFGFATTGDWAYVGGGLCTDPDDPHCDPALIVIDMTDPGRPVRRSEVELGMAQLTVTVDGDMLLVGGFEQTSPTDNHPALRIVDISQPDSPTLLGGVSWDDNVGEVRSLARLGDHVYAARNNDSYLVDVIDVTDVTRPRRVGELSLRSQSLFVHSLAASRGHLMAAGAALDHWHASPPFEDSNAFFVIAPADAGIRGQVDATVVGQLLSEEFTQPANLGEPMAVSGDRAYVTRGRPGGMVAIDTSQLDHPTVIRVVKPVR